jgi:hypothetical protein
MNTEYDLNDNLQEMELFDKGSTLPEKRKLSVTVGEIKMNFGFSLSGLTEMLQELIATCEKKEYTKAFVHINEYDIGDKGKSGFSLVVKAERLETDQEYTERQACVVVVKAKKREFDTKKFYELKKELGL